MKSLLTADGRGEKGKRGWKTIVLKHVAFMSAVLLPFRTQQ